MEVDKSVIAELRRIREGKAPPPATSWLVEVACSLADQVEAMRGTIQRTHDRLAFATPAVVKIVIQGLEAAGATPTPETNLAIVGFKVRARQVRPIEYEVEHDDDPEIVGRGETSMAAWSDWNRLVEKRKRIVAEERAVVAEEKLKVAEAKVKELEGKVKP